MKMNTYLYAPKDDYKHRIYWRHLYSSEEAGWFSAPEIYDCGRVIPSDINKGFQLEGL